MDAESARALLLRLPHVRETVQWGDNLVFWVGDKSVGGKMFALIDLDGAGGPVVAFAAGQERYLEFLDREGLRPAPYLARAHWIAAERWDALSGSEWELTFAAAHAIVAAKLTKRAKQALEASRATAGRKRQARS